MEIAVRVEGGIFREQSAPVHHLKPLLSRNAFRIPSASASAASLAGRHSLNESGAITYFGMVLSSFLPQIRQIIYFNYNA